MSVLPTQVNFRNKGHKLCVDHPKEELVLVCKDCNETLVCVHCVSTTHLGHQLTAVKLLVQDNFNFLHDWNVDTEETKIPRLFRGVEEAETTVTEFQQGIQLQIQRVQGHGEYLKELIEKSTIETVSELKEIEQKILKQFEKFKSDSDTAIRRLEALMKESKEVTKSDNNILICDVTKEFSSLTLQTPEFEYGFNSSRFTKGLDSESHVKAAFGRLEHYGNSLDLETVKQDNITISQNPVFAKLATISKCMGQATRTKQGIWWFCDFRGSPYLYKMNEKGQLNKSKLDVDLRGISLHPLTDQLYCISSSDSSVHTVDTTTMKTTKLFSVDDPVSMAVTHSGNILVKTGGKPKLTMYTSTGSIVQTVTNVPFINLISVCRATGNVAFSCYESGVSVFTDTLQPMFTYPTSGDKIDAQDATFDNIGYLLVADCRNKKIRIIDATTGQLQKIVPVEDGYPTCLTTYSHNSVVMCTDRPLQLISLKYLD